MLHKSKSLMVTVIASMAPIDISQCDCLVLIPPVKEGVGVAFSGPWVCYCFEEMI